MKSSKIITINKQELKKKSEEPIVYEINDDSKDDEFNRLIVEFCMEYFDAESLEEKNNDSK